MAKVWIKVCNANFQSTKPNEIAKGGTITEPAPKNKIVSVKTERNIWKREPFTSFQNPRDLHRVGA